MPEIIDRRLVSGIDLNIIVLLGIILICGLTGLYSATHIGEFTTFESIFKRQLIWLCIGSCALIFSISFSYVKYKRWAILVYLCAILLLILTIFIGKHIQGARRWIGIGFLNIQPSEISKLAIILILSSIVSDREIFQKGYLPDKTSIVGILLTLIPALLILLQPDLGSAIIVVLIGFTVLLLNGMRLWIPAVLIAVVVAFSPIAWNHLKDYQKARISAFLDPGKDPTGAGYHITQSKIAIGSGELLGKGFGRSTQTRLHYLPEQHTDFIFSVIAEEWGFVGASFLVFAYLLLILRCLNLGIQSKDAFGYALCTGVFALLFWHCAINLGMVSGLLPVVGVPLIFVSYGGSSLVVGFISIGLVLNVHMRRFMLKPV